MQDQNTGSAPPMLPDTNAISAWAYHDHAVDKARATARITHPGRRYIQTALGEHISKMLQGEIFHSMVITDTILSELFSLTLTPSAREWKILTKTYGAQFEQQFGRGYLASRDIKNALLHNPPTQTVLPHSAPVAPLIPRNAIEDILGNNHQPLELWFRFLQRNLSFIEFTDSNVIAPGVEDRGERSIVHYIRNAGTIQLLSSAERRAYKTRKRIDDAVPSSYVVVTEDIKAFGIFADIDADVFVMNNRALVEALHQARTTLTGRAQKDSTAATRARHIPVPEPRENQTVELATGHLFSFLAKHMNINTMNESRQMHYRFPSGTQMPFEEFIAKNIRARSAAR